MEIPKSAAIYCRLSYAPDGSVEKVERQEADCRALADRLGWPVEEVYPDNSRSAWQRSRKRPQWDRMLADIEAGRIDGIIVYHGDRLIRQPWDLELLLKLADDRRLSLASVSGTRELSSEDDRFVLRIEAAQACKSSADTSRRVQHGWERRAKEGRTVGGGKRPFGFGVDTGRLGRTGNPLFDATQQVPEEAAVIREAVDRLLAGQTLGGVTAWMNTVSTTSQGHRWASRSLKQVLRMPRIAGLVEHHGTLYDAVWEPVISQEQWEDVKALLDRNGDEYGYHGRARKYLLSGIAECWACGAGLVTKPSGGRNRRTARLYFCKSPDCQHHVSRNVDHLDAYVEGRVLRLLNDERFIDALDQDSDDPGLSGEIAALERRKREAEETFEHLADYPDVSPDMALKAISSFEKRIAGLRDRMSTTSRDRLLRRMAGITHEQWKSEPLDVRAETVRALYRVVVRPTSKRGPGFDSSAVKMRRRSLTD